MQHLESLGRYEIIAVLGEGAMGTVYKAMDPKLDRIVALKTLSIKSNDPDFKDFIERFQAEAKSAGRLSHPNIVVIYDFGEFNAIPFLAMEFLQGETLRQMLDRQRFSSRRAVRYAIQIADGLATAHANDVVHRDIKPANIVRLSNGQIKITDFGIAQLPNSHLTQAGTLVGTPKYMSPEQVRGLRVDGRSDIFSLGVVFYEMLTGTLPFGGATLSALMYQIAHEQPIHPRRWNPTLPEELDGILAKCMAKDPKDRYQVASELAHDLRVYKDQSVAKDAPRNVFLPLDPLSAALSASVANDESGSTVQVLSEALVAPRVTMAKWQNRNTPSALDQTTPIPSNEELNRADLSRKDKRRRQLRWSGMVTGLAAAALLVIWVINPHPDIEASNTDAWQTGPKLIVPDASLHADFSAPIGNTPAFESAPSQTGSSRPVPSVLAHPSTRRNIKKGGENVRENAIRETVAVTAPAPPPPQSTVTPVATHPVAEPTGFEKFLKDQRDCIVDKKCAPPPDPNAIRN